MDHQDESAADFKRALRRHTRVSGFSSLRDPEARTGLSHTTVSNAFNPKQPLPTLTTLHVVLQAAGGDAGHWEERLLACLARLGPAAPATDPAARESGVQVPDGAPAEGPAGVPPGAPAATHAEVGAAAVTGPPGRPGQRRRQWWGAVLLVGVAVAGGGLAVGHAAGGGARGGPLPGGVEAAEPAATAVEDGALVGDRYVEVAIPDNAVSTLRDPLTGRGLGPYIAAGEAVQVSCRLYAPVIPSATPDGWFYRVESPPWDGEYHAAANSFLNGDPPGDPTRYVTATDLDVPVC